jgi:hypothetical protein
MPYSQDEIDALKAAMAAGVQTVEYAGRKTTFMSRKDMVEQLAAMEREVNPCSAPRFSDTVYDRGC